MHGIIAVRASVGGDTLHINASFENAWYCIGVCLLVLRDGAVLVVGCHDNRYNVDALTDSIRLLLESFVSVQDLSLIHI